MTDLNTNENYTDGVFFVCVFFGVFFLFCFFVEDSIWLGPDIVHMKAN